MIEIILFFFITAFCELRISYPPELYNLYPNNIVPSVTANLRRFPTYTQGSVGFLPNDTNPCVRSSWPQFANYTVFAIMDITCHYSTVVHIAEERKAQGVIFVLNLTSSRLKEVLISPGSQTTIFVAGISNEYIDMWRKFEQGVILVELDRDRIYSEKPRISISLTGSFIHDADFIKEWYFYLFPIYKSDVDIDLSFNYSFSCSDCSPNDCYSNNKYCMIDDINHFSGRNMIDRTLMEIALLDYIKNHDIFLGAFAIFLYELGKSCEYDYSKKCSGNVLNWLKVDLEEIQNRIDKSWISNMNEVRADNYILRSQYNKWISKSYFEPIPSISIGNITLCLNQGYGLQTYICNYISYTSYVCDDTCNKNCTIGDLSDGYCDQNCETDSCFNDIQDCNSLLHFCDDIHNRVCKYISDGGDEGLDTGSIIAISIFSSIGFCFCLSGFAVPYHYISKYLEKRYWDRENRNSLEIQDFPLPPSFISPPSLPAHPLGDPLQIPIHMPRINLPDSSSDNDSQNSSEDEIGSESRSQLESSSEIRISIQNSSENKSDYGFFGDATCSICFDAITQENMKITKCKHIFHKDCLKAWTDAKGRDAKCPNCNEEIR